ncbi:hypothetical protein [Halomonas sp. LBP4]|uniref:hypothetical protein n=1 Tax=Halomonas sp. LBP4 TaxID=2044917 RepID=UPI0015E8DF76|nr:hypothetical protein [Halomonas sp. LBP4]
MSPGSWTNAAFSVFMAGVSLFVYVQIERNAYQARQQRLGQEQGDHPGLPR